MIKVDNDGAECVVKDYVQGIREIGAALTLLSIIDLGGSDGGWDEIVKEFPDADDQESLIFERREHFLLDLIRSPELFIDRDSIQTYIKDAIEQKSKKDAS